MTTPREQIKTNVQNMRIDALAKEVEEITDSTRHYLFDSYKAQTSSLRLCELKNARTRLDEAIEVAIKLVAIDDHIKTGD